MENLNWEEEARSIIKDISNCVTKAELSVINTSQQFDSKVAFLNIETKEGDKFTVKLDAGGFSVAGKDFNDTSVENQHKKYETIYALLNHLSPSYALTFAQELTDKLNKLREGVDKCET